MKYSRIVLTAVALMFGNTAFAKPHYIVGTITKVDPLKETISIVESESGNTQTYRYLKGARVDLGATSATKRVRDLRAGEEVTLKLKKIEIVEN